MSNETTRKPLTEITWNDLRMYGLVPSRNHDSIYSFRMGWEVQSDLGYELAAMTRLSDDEARRLVSATVSGLPIVITWDTRIGNRYEGWQVQRTRTTVIVEGVTPPSKDHPESVPGQARLHYSGFAHPIYLNQIVKVEAVECDRQFFANESDALTAEQIAEGMAEVAADDADPVDLADEAAGNHTPGSEY